MWLYKIEYYGDRYDRITDYVLAKDKEEALEKFNKVHPHEKGMIVGWQHIDY